VSGFAPAGVVCTPIRMKSRDIIRALEADGWSEARQKGSHKQFRHPTKPGTVTVPHPESDMAIGTIKSIEKQSGLTFR
jgi:predicted RNA binding protein YcfA (HicA-like mRNA interferase family)